MARGIEMKNINEILQTDWVFATENYDDDFHTDIVFLRVIENEFIINSGKRHKKVLVKYNGTYNQLFFSRKESIELSEQLIKLFFNNSEWRKNIHFQIRRYSGELGHLYDGIDISNIRLWSLDELISIYKSQHAIKQQLYYWGWIAETMHASNNSIETHLKHYLVSLGVPKEKISIVFSDLLFCPSSSVYDHEQIELQLIIDYIRKKEKYTNKRKIQNSITSEIREMVSRIHDKYKYLYYHGYRNHPRNVTCYYSLIQDYLKENRNFYNPALKNQQREAFDSCCMEYMINENSQDIFMSYAELGVSKSIRRLAELKNFYYVDAIISELSYRFNISENIIRFMKPEELIAIQTIDKATLEEIALRTNKMIYYYNGINESIITDDLSINAICEVATKDKVDSIIIQGSIACAGVANGKVHIINKSSEIDKMEQIFKHGDILVSYEPNPDFISLIRKSGAIVTDQGGITCHIASIARELNIPCIVGTESATSTLKEGDFVFVDANNGIVLIKGEKKDD